MKISLEKFDFRKNSKLVAIWHEDHVKINFPDSKYKKSIFINSLKRKPKNEMSMVKVGDEYVGFLWLKRERDIFKELYFCNLKYIHVIPEYRSKGVGSYLMKEVDKYSKRNGCCEIRLGTSVSNKRAINLYKKCGFVIKRVLMEKKLC